MFTRSKSIRGDAPVNSGGETGVPQTSALDRASGPILVEAFAAPHPVTTILTNQSLQESCIQSTNIFSRTVEQSNSRASISSKSSVTIRALQAAAEARLARQQLERLIAAENERREREIQLEGERRRIEQLELAAEFADIKASRSQVSVCSAARNAAWVAEQVKCDSVASVAHCSNDVPTTIKQNIPDTCPVVTSPNINTQRSGDVQKLAMAIISAVTNSKKSYELTPFNSDPIEGLIFKKNYNPPFTKRKVLSYLMRIHNSIGLLLPYTIEGRVLFQSTWKMGVDWDTELPSGLVDAWVAWMSKLPTVNQSRISRWYGYGPGSPIERELHVFCDASELAYSCVVYWRYIYADGNVRVTLVGGNGRVAPKKPVSIPRLELQGALIGSRFANIISEAHRNKPTRVFYWTDSTTVLSWLRNDCRLFKPFVMHRVSEIAEVTDISSWRYIPGKLNVADDATRPGNSLTRWFLGPSFLLLDQSEWPSEPKVPTAALEEVRVTLKDVAMYIDVHPTKRSVPSPVTAEPGHFSSWLVKLALSFDHFWQNYLFPNSKIRRDFDTPVHPISLVASHIIKSEEALFQRSQVECFEEEIFCLLTSTPIRKQSKLYRLAVTYQDGLLRLAGRVDAVENVDQVSNCPIVLDGGHLIVRLFISHLHEKTGHGNNETVVNMVRERFWVLRCRNVVRSVARKCQMCLNKKAQPQIPSLGDLPAVRLAHHQRPFTYVGVDYFGPLNISIGRRQEKRYGAVYTCLTSRALHLEVVASLSADSAILSLRRLIARRGCPSKILSDNGTCFVGANKQLGAFFNEKIHDFAANNKITWQYIPPASPFMGGCWKRLVRSVKAALSVTLKEKAPSEEVLQTVFAEAEAIINSRPLVHVPVDPEDLIALTPFHFLIGAPSYQQLPASVQLSDKYLLGRNNWKKVLRLSDHFWSRWVKEYLPTLIPRRQPQTCSLELPLEVGQVVLIVDDNLPRGVWPIGRISTLYPGKDGTVRVVEVATKAGIFKRPVRKIVRLPV